MALSKPCRILVAEDEGLIARDIASRLEVMGHQVAGVVSTVREAVDEAPGADIVLMDIRLDGPGDGIQAADLIRKNCGKPVVFLTAHADRSTLERAKHAIPFGYVVKPVQSATLAATLEMAVFKHGMERELAEQRGLLDAVLASVADAILVAGPAGEIRLLNAAAEALSGWTAGDAKGKPIGEVLPLFQGGAASLGFSSLGISSRSPGGHKEDPVPLALLRGEAVEIGRGVTLARRDGVCLLVEGSAAPVHVNGALAGVVVNLRDVGARDWEEGQARLAHKMEAATRLAAGVADEYANLLAVMRNRAGRLIEQFPEYATVRSAAEDIDQAAFAAERITRRLAGLGARQLPNPEVFSLNGLLRRTRKLIESIAGEGAAVAIHADPETGKLWADGLLIEQALMNLVVHASASMAKTTAAMGAANAGSAEARDASLPARRLTIETGNAELRAAGGMRRFVRLSVTYSGDEPGADDLFDPSQLEDGRITLSIAHNIVGEHGGYLSAFPAAGGHCFEILLPRHAEPGSGAETAVSGGAPGILLVEPNETLRRELQNFFEAQGYRLLDASDTAEALALADLHEGALDVAIAARADAGILASPLRRRHPGLKILEIADAGMPESTAEPGPAADPAGQLAIDARISRPFTEAALLDQVRGLLGPVHKPAAAFAG